jgi:hypothetical protein
MCPGIGREAEAITDRAKWPVAAQSLAAVRHAKQDIQLDRLWIIGENVAQDDPQRGGNVASGPYCDAKGQKVPVIQCHWFSVFPHNQLLPNERCPLPFLGQSVNASVSWVQGIWAFIAHQE